MDQFYKRISFLFLVVIFNAGHLQAKWGYNFVTCGLFGGYNFYQSYRLYDAGINFDRYYKACTGFRSYEGVQLCLGRESKVANNLQFRLRLMKGFIRPFMINRVVSIHPVISISPAYHTGMIKNYFSISPEIGCVLVSNARGILSSRLMAFYGYQFAEKNKEKLNNSGGIMGLKLVICTNFRSWKKTKETTSEQN